MLNLLFGGLCVTVNNPGIDVYESFFDEKDIRDEPIGRYFNHSYSTVVLIYAPSQQDAVEMLNLLFGGLCVTVNNPFAINSCDVNNKVESFSEGAYHISNFRVNIPSGNKTSIIGGVCRDAISILDVRSKIEIIYELRCRFVHGDISTLSAHVKYLKFVDCHGADPVESLFEILKECVLNYQGVYEAPKEYSNSRTMNVPVELAEDVKKMIESFKSGK
ncbi:hypothetical protein KAM622c_16050 [Klebsiella quasipneumoniae subsp. quasipneumoniae]|nr:hypothetical protein KAM622c_16050 [Klebsiella quasipneumoniae subsp. quasipneumoniae]